MGCFHRCTHRFNNPISSADGNFLSRGSLATFGPSHDVQVVNFLNNLGYYTTLITVNAPQLILSFIYLLVSMPHKKLQVEKEWNSYALAYKPLRVSFPHGSQTSTYRLQLPSLYSIPLICTSAALHWMMSNCLFILTFDGTQSAYLTSATLLSCN